MSERDAVTRAEVCVVAVAECFRGDGEILANPIGTIPMIGGRLARATLRARPGDDRRRGHVRRQRDAGRRGPTRKVGRGVEPLPADVRRGVERHAPRDDGRQPDRPLRQPELRLHRRLRTAQGAAARLPGRARATPINNTTSLLDPEPLAQACSSSTSTWCAASATTAPPQLGDRRARVPRDPPRGHQPRRPRLRDARPPHAAAQRAPRRHRRRGGRGHRVRAGRSPTTCPRPGSPTAEELRAHPRGDRSQGLREKEVPS